MIRTAIQALRSPFARHPRLGWRKIQERLHGERPLRIPERDATWCYQPPANLRVVLQEWMDSLHWNSSEDWSPFRVFATDHPEGKLWEYSRHGPPDTQGLKGDIKLPWEFSRAYHLPLNAARAANAPDKSTLLKEQAAWIHTWLSVTEDLGGVVWMCAMEVAIRAVNWLAADLFWNGQLREAVGTEAWDQALWLHGHLIEQRLEARIWSSNHYLSNLMGLAWISAFYRGQRDAERWHQFVYREWPPALSSQLRPDGGSYEGSLPYHALDVEMMLLTQATIPNRGQGLAALRSMLAVLRGLCPPDGGVWKSGDDDSGRVLAVDFISRERRIDVLLRLAQAVLADEEDCGTVDCLFPDSGWWQGTNQHTTAFVSFGGAGMGGRGGHTHNDQGSLQLWCDSQPILVDPGSYLYTSDPVARNLFRSTARHNTVSVDGHEHRQIPAASPHDVFRLPGDPRPAKVIQAGQHGIELQSTILRGHGIPLWCRSVQVLPTGIDVNDTFQTQYPQHVRSHLIFHPTCTVGEMIGDMIEFHCGAVSGSLIIPSGTRVTREFVDVSPSYGCRQSACALRMDHLVQDRHTIHWQILWADGS